MKKYLHLLAALVFLMVSCDEWEPVLGNQGEPEEPKAQTPAVTTSIMDLKLMYKGKPLHIEDDIVIGGQVVSSDVSGNIYRSLYIQDNTSGIEVKIGNSALYNDYKLGQWVYVRCQGLELGDYGGMVQLGMEDPTGEYETAYIDVKTLISSHIIKGEKGTPLPPATITENEVRTALRNGYKSPLFGMYVTLKDLTYANEIFALIYMDGNVDKSLSSNRLFLSGQRWGVDTWAMSSVMMRTYLISGVWDSARIGNSGDYNYGTVGDLENLTKLLANSAAYAVSQYFTMPGGTEIQIRSSGYAKFADVKMEPQILDGSGIDVTGILTCYNGAAQFTLLDLDGVKIKN